MLRELKIENLAIIDTVRLEWREGFTALTGETGAGKSILLNALKFILGAKVKPDLIRRGAEKMRVEAVFDIPPTRVFAGLLKELEIDSDFGELILERELSAAGKNRCRLNGAVITPTRLEEIGSHLVDLHGQHQQQSLINSHTHLGFLDAYARLDSMQESYARLFQIWKESLTRLRKRQEEAQRVKEQYDFYLYQFKELDKVKLTPGEEEDMERELKVLSGLEKIAGGLQAGLSLLDGEDGDLLGGMAKLQKELGNLRKLLNADALEGYAEKLEEARSLLTELCREMRHFPLPESADPAQLDALNARMALIQRLKGKYQTDLDGLIALRHRRHAEIQLFQNSDAEIQGIKEEIRNQFAELVVLAADMSTQRRKAAGDFDSKVNRMLHSLGMEGSSFLTRIQGNRPGEEEYETLTLAGFDRLEFFLAANAGEEAKPLKLVASGGEISRVMLGIKAVLAECDPRPLLVFDELDSGIGGTTANRVGNVLKELAQHHQLLVITHLHQVAALATHQHKVVKSTEQGRTVTRVSALDAGERIQELARMMGDETSSATLEHARELLTQG